MKDIKVYYRKVRKVFNKEDSEVELINKELDLAEQAMWNRLKNINKEF